MRVLITGGARGIGRAAAELALAQGARVAVWALHSESVEEVKTAVPAIHWADAVDVGERDAVERGVKKILEAMGPIDVLINNAGYTLTSRFLEEEPAYWERVIATNFWGAVYTMRAVLPHMVQRGQGSIVNVVSDAGRVGMAGEAVYAGAKGGVVAFSKSIAQEMARHQIRVNCVAPGPTRTRILESNTEDGDAEKLIEKMIRRIPLRRIAEPHEVAEAVLFLASPAASHITGQVLSVSGGLTMI
ncbi:SDR family NAD(P)-dependent oxidoreductase [Sulfobacillus harzensis]|nr:SDR family NAD(P)-dependent oxidoreductase [Sulfobacillus harzensis]